MKCSRCKSTNHLEKYSKFFSKRSGWTQYYLCKECNTNRMRKYRKTTHGKKATSLAVKKYDRNNPERRKAWSRTPEKLSGHPCVICEKLPTDMHHPNYDKPTVTVSLCRLHHVRLHKMIDML